VLKPAVFYVEKLQASFAEWILRDSFKFFSRDSNILFVLDVYPDSSEILQFVSVDDKDRVAGYFGCRINRETDTAYDLEIANFGDREGVFTIDLADWFFLLYKTFGIKRVVWWVIAGNPAEKFYDRFIDFCGGRVVGIFKNDTKLRDGRLYDVKWYEIFTEDALKRAEDTGATKENYRKYFKGGADCGKQ